MCCREKLFVFLGTQIGGSRWFADLGGEVWKRPRRGGGGSSEPAPSQRASAEGWAADGWRVRGVGAPPQASWAFSDGCRMTSDGKLRMKCYSLRHSPDLSPWTSGGFREQVGERMALYERTLCSGSSRLCLGRPRWTQALVQVSPQEYTLFLPAPHDVAGREAKM